MPKQFIDKHALIGGVSRSDSSVICIKDKQKIRFIYDRSDRKFHLYIPGYDAIKVTKRNAIKLAKWILTYEGVKLNENKP